MVDLNRKLELLTLHGGSFLTRKRWQSIPRCRAASAVVRAWLDPTPPIVTTQSHFFKMASPKQKSSLRTYFVKSQWNSYITSDLCSKLFTTLKQWISTTHLHFVLYNSHSNEFTTNIATHNLTSQAHDSFFTHLAATKSTASQVITFDRDFKLWRQLWEVPPVNGRRLHAQLCG